MGNVGTRFRKGRRMCRIIKCDISDSAVLIWFIFQISHNESNSVIEAQCETSALLFRFRLPTMQLNHWVTSLEVIAASSGATKALALLHSHVQQRSPRSGNTHCVKLVELPFNYQNGMKIQCLQRTEWMTEARGTYHSITPPKIQCCDSTWHPSVRDT